MKTHLQTILVIEDDPNDQLLIVEAFKYHGITKPIQVVSNGQEAIDYLSGKGEYSHRKKFAFPAFIMTDLKMPQGDGFMVLEALRNDPKWRLVPAVVFSSSLDPDDLRRSYLLGASSYHIKPRGLKELREQIKILNDYWCSCQFPPMDENGNLLPTESEGKLGERFSTPGE